MEGNTRMWSSHTHFTYIYICVILNMLKCIWCKGDIWTLLLLCPSMYCECVCVCAKTPRMEYFDTCTAGSLNLLLDSMKQKDVFNQFYYRTLSNMVFFLPFPFYLRFVPHLILTTYARTRTQLFYPLRMGQHVRTFMAKVWSKVDIMCPGQIFANCASVTMANRRAAKQSYAHRRKIANHFKWAIHVANSFAVMIH